jgi:hypothetical protein
MHHNGKTVPSHLFDAAEVKKQGGLPCFFRRPR